MQEKREFHITVLDSLTEQVHGKQKEKSYLYKKIKGKCNFIQGDIRDMETVIEAIKDQEYIIHLAAETGTGQSMYEVNRYNEVNIMGTSNLLQAMLKKKEKVKKVILASSRSVYGEGKYECKRDGYVYPKGRKIDLMKQGDFSLYCPICGDRITAVPTTENSDIKPQSLYGFTKYSQENLVELMCKSLKIDYSILRLQNVYGIGQSLNNPYTGILSIFSVLLRKNKKINIFEDGNESRDFINVIDVAGAFIKVLKEEKTNFEILNIGSGEGKTVMEIAKMLKKLYSSKSEIQVTGDFRVGDIAHNIADISKANKMIQFFPVVTLEKGLENFCKWVSSQNIENDSYENSIEEMKQVGMLIRG